MGSNTSKQNQGFSLVEFLLSLIIIGAIAVLLIPGYLQSVGVNKKQAVFKETLQTLTQLLDEGLSNDSLIYNNASGSLNWSQYFLSNLNGTVTCPHDSATDSPPCWNVLQQGIIGTCGAYQQPGVILPNGVTIIGFNNALGSNAVVIDWNGPQGSNQLGDDQLYINMYATGSGASNGTIGPVPAGTCGLTATQVAANQALYNWVMQPVTNTN